MSAAADLPPPPPLTFTSARSHPHDHRRGQRAEFGYLREALGLTPGNLSST